MSYDKIKYNNDYNKEKYAEIKIRVAKDMKPKIIEHAKNKGYGSTNDYINNLIKSDMGV